jgi:hypothetical protein
VKDGWLARTKDECSIWLDEGGEERGGVVERKRGNACGTGRLDVPLAVTTGIVQH